MEVPLGYSIICSSAREAKPCGADQLVARALNLAAQYRDMGVTSERILMRIPGSWEGLQAAKQLEQQGVRTHIILVYRSACCSVMPLWL